ncbi:hypothetical protein [Caulobacter flavus]|uniref:hypothetical protein n=1 Tax=Caulobacter flavus TaxID=1679497 RepID=UPI0013DDEB82|nr:hypothetical protein [Caulobacter flavus]
MKPILRFCGPAAWAVNIAASPITTTLPLPTIKAAPRRRPSPSMRRVLASNSQATSGRATLQPPFRVISG